MRIVGVVVMALSVPGWLHHRDFKRRRARHQPRKIKKWAEVIKAAGIAPEK
jgi:hypothetical protein